MAGPLTPVNPTLLAIASLAVLPLLLPFTRARRSPWSVLSVGAWFLAALANNAYDYRLFGVLGLLGSAFFAIHLRVLLSRRGEQAQR